MTFNSSSFGEAQIKSPTLPLFETATFIRELYTKDTVPPLNPYSVGLVSDKNGIEHTVLIASEEFDLNKVPFLNGLEVRVQPTELGIRLKPLSMQSETFLKVLTERLVKSPADDTDADQCTVGDNLNNNSDIESRGDERLSAMPALRSLISRVASECQKHQLAAAAWLFLPATPFIDDQND